MTEIQDMRRRFKTEDACDLEQLKNPPKVKRVYLDGGGEVELPQR